MKRGYLSEHFKGVAAKTLSAVEANPAKSNQHEFNGVSKLKKILGEEKRTLPASFVYLCDEEDEPVLADGFLTWYDARENHVKRSEHRLYFNTSAVSERAEAGDLFVFGLREDGSALAIIAEGGSTAENQVRWLFGLDEDQASFSVQGEAEADAVRLEYASNLILDQIGVERAVEPEAENFLEKILAKFGDKFPTTREFSAFARASLALNPLDDPDGVLIAFMEREEALFRALERHIISERLKTGFDGDVDGFISFSLSVQNRRKSRAGHALENHLSEIFTRHGLRHDRTAVTENKSKPDFLFPGAVEYRNPAFPTERLTALASKSSAKDRWRQVLAEADRIEEKHLLTLEPGISENQTNEMKSRKLSLVLPKSIHSSYSANQQAWLMDVAGFIGLVRERQGA